MVGTSTRGIVPGEEVVMVSVPIERVTKGLRRRFLRAVPDGVFVPWQYRVHNGRPADLRAPRDLSEKLCWMKLHYMTPLQVQCSDKLRARDYVAATVGADKLVPLIMTTQRVEDVNPSRITQDKFVVKANHDSGGVFLCNGRESFDWEQVRRLLCQRLRQNFYYETRERVYRDIVPSILVEEHLGTFSDEPVVDYKLWTFGGRAEFFQISKFVKENNRTVGNFHLFLDRDWQKLPIKKHMPLLEVAPPRPGGLDALIETAEALAAPFPFCRVDLYHVAGQVWFGELTFYPSGGFTRFSPDDWERRLGDLVPLPEANLQ
jgi:hypothetical protein